MEDEKHMSIEEIFSLRDKFWRENPDIHKLYLDVRQWIEENKPKPPRTCTIHLTGEKRWGTWDDTGEIMTKQEMDECMKPYIPQTPEYKWTYIPPASGISITYNQPAGNPSILWGWKCPDCGMLIYGNTNHTH